VNNLWIRTNNLPLRFLDVPRREISVTEPTQKLPPEIEVFSVGWRRLYVKTSGNSFAFFEDDLTPEQLIAIARDISAHRSSDRDQIRHEISQTA
jgi:hypothetical protein